MKRIRYLIVLIMAFILFSSNVNAETCKKITDSSSIILPKINESALLCTYKVDKNPAITSPSNQYSGSCYSTNLSDYMILEIIGQEDNETYQVSNLHICHLDNGGHCQKMYSFTTNFTGANDPTFSGIDTVFGATKVTGDTNGTLSLFSPTCDFHYDKNKSTHPGVTNYAQGTSAVRAQSTHEFDNGCPQKIGFIFEKNGAIPNITIGKNISKRSNEDGETATLVTNTKELATLYTDYFDDNFGNYDFNLTYPYAYIDGVNKDNLGIIALSNRAAEQIGFPEGTGSVMTVTLSKDQFKKSSADGKTVFTTADSDDLLQYYNDYLEDASYDNYKKLINGVCKGKIESLTNLNEGNSRNNNIGVEIKEYGNGVVPKTLTCNYYYGEQIGNSCVTKPLVINYYFAYNPYYNKIDKQDSYVSVDGVKAGDAENALWEYIDKFNNGTYNSNSSGLTIQDFFKSAESSIDNLECVDELYIHRLDKDRIDDGDSLFGKSRYSHFQNSVKGTNEMIISVTKSLETSCSFMFTKSTITEVPYGCVDHSKDVACGSLYNIPKDVPKLTSLLMNLVKIFTPLVLIIKGIIDLFKAMTGSNEQEIEKAKSKFFKRLIPAVLVFLVIVITQTIFRIIGTNKEANTLVACVNCFLNNNCGPYTDAQRQAIEEYNAKYCDALKNGDSFTINGTNYTTRPTNNYDNNTSNNNTNTSSNSNTTSTPGTLSGAESTTRNKVVNFAKDAYTNQNSKFVYLSPSSSERDASSFSYICLKKENGNCVSKMNASGGGCRMSTYNGNTCMTYNGNSYMGTDCNGFVGYIYHMSIGLESSSGRFFEPLYNDKDWKTLYSNYFQKNEKVKTVQEALNIAQPGDAIARICDEVNGSHHNHIGVYVGNGMMVENSGSTSSVDGRLTPLVYRKVEEFAKIGSYSSSNYKNCVLTVFTLKKF